MTRLEAINQMLAGIGESPVSNESSQHPDVLFAVPILDRVLEELLARGWWFNTDDEIELSPDTNGNIILPSDALEVDPIDPTEDYVQRNGKLYNKQKSTYVFTKSVKLRMVVSLAFDYLPRIAASYVADMATYILHRDRIGDTNRMKELKDLTTLSWSALNSKELRNRDYNARLSPRPLKLLSGVIPYRSR